MKTSASLFICAALCFSAGYAAPKTELGDLNGAKFRIDVPENWNGGLVIYCHGYNPDAGGLQRGETASDFRGFHQPGIRAGAVRLCCRRLGGGRSRHRH